MAAVAAHQLNELAHVVRANQLAERLEEPVAVFGFRAGVSGAALDKRLAQSLIALAPTGNAGEPRGAASGGGDVVVAAAGRVEALDEPLDC